MKRANKKKRSGLLYLAAVSMTTLVVTGFTSSFVRSTYPDDGAAIPDADVNTSSDTPSGEETSESFAKTRTFGVSEKGREIEGYELGTGSECLLFFGGIHGNEKGTVVLLEQLADEVIAKPELVAPTKRVVIIPLLNPDGYSEGIYRDNTNGVNLNRNFLTTGWTANPDTTTFAGLQPFSEAESSVLRDVVEECQPSLMLAFHSQGGVVSPELGKDSMALAEWYIAKTGYAYYNDWDYPGTATKWFTETTGKPALTVEITNHIESDWEINQDALLQLINSERGF